MEILIKAAQLILSLSILVIFHEMGHFLFARLFKTRVEKFYLFFNPWFSLFKTKWGETEYGIGWLPLGGYVKISGMIDESMDKEQMAKPPQPHEFRSKKSWQRLLIMVGGVLVNFILAFLIYTMILTVWGRQYLPIENVKYGMAVDSTAQQLGFQNGDKILKLDGEKIIEFEKLTKKIILDDVHEITVDRNGKMVNISMDPELEVRIKMGLFSPRVPFFVGGFGEDSTKSNAYKAGIKVNDKIIGLNNLQLEFFDEFRDEVRKHAGKEVEVIVLRDGQKKLIKTNVSEEGIIGASNSYNFFKEFGRVKLEYSFLEAIPASFPLGYELITDQLKQLKLIPANIKDVGGFGAIGSIFPATWDWEAFWMLTAMLSVMLAVLNLLPIPALDGGHVMFLLYEMVSGRKPSEKFMEYAQTVGMVLLLALLVYANGNDIYKAIFN